MRRWNPNQQYHDPGYQQEYQFQNPNHYRPPPMGHQYDFMARTQKAFNQGRSYSHQDPNHGEWSQGESDNNDPNGQPFQ